MKKIAFLLTLILLVFIAVFIGSPYYTAYQLKNAYDTHDGDALTQHIDFNQLQPNIENQLKNRFSATLIQYPFVAKLGGDALTNTANGFIEQATRQAITSDNISSLVNTQGQANRATREFAASWAIATNKVDLQNLIQELIVQRGDVDAVIKSQIEKMMVAQSSELEKNAQSGQDSENPELSYCGINCFTISGQLKGYPVTVELVRHGFIEWKVENVILP